MRGRVLCLFAICILLVCGSRSAAAQNVPDPGALLPGSAPVSRPAVAPETGLPDSSNEHRVTPLPSGVILLPGAVPYSSDRLTALPESSRIAGRTYRNDYFGLTFTLPAGWTQRYDGPPPSDSGAYVLAELVPDDKSDGAKGTIIITAQDRFFSLRDSGDAMAMVKDASDRLEPFYEVERAPVAVTIADRAFARFDYKSPAAQLHWVVLATEVRCHVLRFVFTSRDTALLESLVKSMDAIEFAAADAAPQCIANYATGANVAYAVQPVLDDRRFNPIPVRIIVGTNGRVRHVHVISAFAEQSHIVTDAVTQWRFTPYVHNGAPAEVETGILFGTATRGRTTQATASAAPRD